MFKEEDSLPGSEGKFSVHYRDNFTGPGQRHSQMAGAVIGAFVGMNEEGKVFRYEIVEEGMQIGPRLRIGIFHDHEAGAGVLDKDGELAGLDLTGGDKVVQLAGDLIGSFSSCGNGEFMVVGSKGHAGQRREGHGGGRR